MAIGFGSAGLGCESRTSRPPIKPWKLTRRQIAANRKTPYCWTCRGAIWRSKGDYERAIHDFSEAIRLDPRQVAAYNDRGSAYSHEGRYDSAINDLSEAIRLDPTFVPAYANRGIVWCRSANIENAIRDLSEAIRLDPKDPEAYHNRGGALGRQRRLRTGRSAISPRRSELDATNALAYYNRAGARKETGDYRGALKDYGQVIRLDPTDAERLCRPGQRFRRTGRIRKRTARLSRGLAGRPKVRGGLQQSGLARRRPVPTRTIATVRQAVENATQACQLTEWKDSSSARHAGRRLCRVGRLRKRPEMGREGHRAWPPTPTRSSCRAHLALYQAGKPYRG